MGSSWHGQMVLKVQEERGVLAETPDSYERQISCSDQAILGSHLQRFEIKTTEGHSHPEISSTKVTEDEQKKS